MKLKMNNNTYTTLLGNKVALTPAVWKGIKRCARKNFDGSNRLFDNCWKTYKRYLNGSIDDPNNLSDVVGWLDSIASEKVNNEKSIFYIYG